jgi:protein-L-isoaspartate(D-aspartate) O-methyltransferase
MFRTPSRGHDGTMSESADPASRLRAEMVAQLRQRGGVSDPRVAAALSEVPRHLFVPGVELRKAYGDQAIPTHYRDGVPTSSASQPAIVATMLEQLLPPPGGSVLEIGAGTGYNAALLSGLVGPSGQVVTNSVKSSGGGGNRTRAETLSDRQVARYPGSSTSLSWCP